MPAEKPAAQPAPAPPASGPRVLIPVVLPGCEAVGGPEITFADEADAKAHLTGRWVLCSGPGLAFATDQPHQAGLELDADDGWRVLRRDGAALAPADGSMASGTFKFPQPQDLMFIEAKQAILFFDVDWSFGFVTMQDSSPRTMSVHFSDPLDPTESFYARIGD